MKARAVSLEEFYSAGYKTPVVMSLVFHALVFVWNPVIIKGSTLKPVTEFMQIRYQDHLPVPPAVAKPEPPKPAPKKKAPPPKRAKKSGLSLAQKAPTPLTVTKRTPPKLAPKPFVSKIEIPKYVPRVKEDDILAASPAPGISTPARQRMSRAVQAAPMLTAKTRGVRAQDIDFRLTDRGSVGAGAGLKAVVIPIGETQGDTPYLPPAAVLSQAPKAKSTMQGYRYQPGTGEGSGELVGKNKKGYVGMVQAPVYVSGSATGGGGLGKGKAASVVAGQGFEIGGPIGDRKILKRRLPQYPDWAEEKGISAMVQIYFTVRSDGSIRSNVRIERSSGYPELDQLAKEALMNWKFSSTSASSSEETAWGVITFRFTLS